MAASSADQPYVDLFVGPLDAPVPPRGVEEAITSAFLAARAAVIKEAKEQARRSTQLNSVVLSNILDVAWHLFLPSFHKITAPYLVNAYWQGYRAARAGEVNPKVINALAEDYAARMGLYFHTTSREAVVGGFNTYVNRRVPARVAAERVLEAYGLTPRQMAGVTSGQFDQKVDSPVAFDARRRLRDYVTTSLRQRLRIFAVQESHNLSQQAQQTAWLWLVQNEQLSAEAEKVWLTAKDEKVCRICGPLHGTRVKVGEQFETAEGLLWTPGAHVNCRCEVHLVVPGRELFGKADRWFNDEYKRTSDGRFAETRYKVADRPDPRGFQSLLDEMFAEPAETETEDVSFAQEKVSFRSGSLKPMKFAQDEPDTETSFTAKPEENVSFVAPKERLHPKLDEVTFAQTDKISFANPGEKKLAKPSQEVRYRPTINLLDPQVLGHPLYAVVPDEMFDHDGRVMVTGAVTFYESETQAQDSAITKADYLREALIEDIVATGRDQRGDGSYYSDENIHDVMDWVLAQDGADGGYRGTSIEVEMFDENDNQIDSEEVLMEEAAFDLGIRAEDLRVNLVELSEGYADPAQGFTEHASGDTWSVEGTYQVIPRRREMWSNNRLIHTYVLEPEVEEIPMGEFDD